MSDAPDIPRDGETRENTESAENTELNELNDEGLGGTIGEKDTFEPEESEQPDK
ncbi:MAG: hypothetical protein Q4G51_08820 [Dermatophilus congolensis]|nr:hypothetical protein [Dermatophilus congolensis]